MEFEIGRVVICYMQVYVHFIENCWPRRRRNAKQAIKSFTRTSRLRIFLCSTISLVCTFIKTLKM